MKKIVIISFLIIIFGLSVFGFSKFLNVSAQVTCSYIYSDWSACVSGIKTRTYTVTPTDCTYNPLDPPVTQQTCSDYSSTTCTYTYGDWGPCATSGIQTRSYTPTPTGCYQATAPLIYQTCAYSSSTVTCANQCGDWSACVSGFKTRTCVQIPAGCIPNPNDPMILQQTCSENTNYCIYAYGDWGPCATSGIQTRSYTQSPSGCYQAAAPFTQQTCTYYGASGTVPCVYVYSDWSTCVSGYKTRTYTKTPEICYSTPGYTPIVQQTCSSTYSGTSTQVICSYVYSDWSACATSGLKTRTYTKTPAGCTMSTSTYPVTYQTCTYSSSTVTCANQCSDWSACVSGIKTRTCAQIPAGCIPNSNDTAATKQTCVPTASTTASCSYIYSDWSGCNNGIQTREVVSRTPSGCHESTTLVLEKTCTVQATTDIENKITACNYSYSAWGDCVSNIQKRMVISKSPDGCDENIAPVLSRSCTSSMTVEIVRPVDIPAPAPESVVVPQIVKDLNFNGRTSGEWQKYYFGSERCLDSVLCGGDADPDNDGLNNNDEYRFGTGPKDSDTDHDGRVDGQEIQEGTDPLLAAIASTTDKIVFESPKDNGVVKEEVYQVKDIQTVAAKDGGKKLKITGKALPNTYVTVYIYSEPIVLTVKTDSEGNWSYTLDKSLEDGKHEVYVAVTDNTGKVAAKSQPLAFVQTAEAATIIPNEKTTSESLTKNWLSRSYLIFFLAGLLGLFLVIVILGTIKGNAKKEDNGSQ
jgi:hypothetical protein